MHIERQTAGRQKDRQGQKETEAERVPEETNTWGLGWHKLNTKPTSGIFASPHPLRLCPQGEWPYGLRLCFPTPPSIILFGMQII